MGDLQDSLAALARRADAGAARAGEASSAEGGVRHGRAASGDAPPAAGAVLGIPVALAEQFAALVDGEFDGPVLPYARRQALLAAAARLGIGRFDANLIIAAVQHRRPVGAAGRSSPKRLGWLAVVGGILVVEALLAAGAWWVFR